MTKERHRIFGLDVLRIVCALSIFCTHSITMFGCTYGVCIDGIILNLTSPIMTCFFMISGFTLFYQYQNKQITGSSIIKFFAKRLLTILPSYYLVHVLWIIFYRESASDWLALTPVELVGIQSAYNSLFGILHNGGTWFVSCILFSYLFFPVLQNLLLNAGIKIKIVSIVLIYFVLVYSNYIVVRFGLNGNYENPAFRMLEFSYGAMIGSVLLNNKKDMESRGGRWGFWSAIGAGTAGCIIILMKCGMAGVTKICLPIPVISVLLYLVLNIRNKKLEKSRVLSILGKISYQFFLAQLFLWKISAAILHVLKKDSNRARIIVSLLCCLIMSLFVYYFYDRPIQRVIMTKSKLFNESER